LCKTNSTCAAMAKALALAIVTFSFAVVSAQPSSLRGVSNASWQTADLAGLKKSRRPRDFWNSSSNTSAEHLLLLSSSDRCGSQAKPLDSKCTGCPPMKDGKLCASSTWYEDTTRGSCGCGDRGHVPDDFWTLTEYTAAMNCVSMDPDNPRSGWCPDKCGECFELCSTGGTTQGTPPAAGTCRVFKVTNRCGDGFDDNRPNWCSQHLSWQDCKANPSKCRKTGSTNHFGYPAHFDLQDFHDQITDGLDWDNAEVTFEQVSCSRWTGPADVTCQGCQ